MTQEQSPLDVILGDIQKALDAQLYYLALMVTLSMPDFCISLACDPNNIWTNRDKYLAWCNQYLVSKFGGMTAEDCYRIRCGVVHNGNFGRPDHRFDRIIFTIPLPNAGRVMEMEFRNNAMNGEKLDDLLGLDIVFFCENFAKAVREWFEDNKEDANVRKNLLNFVRLRLDGYKPFYVGTPVIA